MIKNLYKINDNVFFHSVILILILWNLKYFVLPIQVAYTAITQNFYEKNAFYAPVSAIKEEIKQLPDFYDEGKVGFVSDINQANVFDKEESIKAFYIAQYAVIPSIMKNDTGEKYVIGAFFKKEEIPKDFSIEKKISPSLYLLKNNKGEK